MSSRAKGPFFDFRISPYSFYNVLAYLLLFSYLLPVTINRRYVPVSCWLKRTVDGKSYSGCMYNWTWVYWS